jgi:hypothetical protein
VLIEADKALVTHLRRDVDELDEELTRLEEACRFEERETTRERAEVEHVGQERQHLMQQLAASQRQLSELKLEHEGIVLENVMLRCDHDHFAKEAVFLRKLLDEGTRDAQALQQSIEYLEQSNSNLRAHTKTLEEARNEVLDTVKGEKELLRKERDEAEFAQRALEALRTDGVDGLMRISGGRPGGDMRPIIPADGIQRSRGNMGNGMMSNGGPGIRDTMGNGMMSNGSPGSRMHGTPGSGGYGNQGWQSGFQNNFPSQQPPPFPGQRDQDGAGFGGRGDRPQGQRPMNLQRERDGV